MPDLFDHMNKNFPFSSKDIMSSDLKASTPLGNRLRPQSLMDVLGQDHLLGRHGAIGQMLASGRLSSLILWGPPGVGKTTIARLLSDAVDYQFEQFSAVFSGVSDLKAAFDRARVRQKMGQKTLIFVDEIHRFHRGQQDGFLHCVEEGLITLIGATTENPSFALNSALLSRCQVFVLKPLERETLEELLRRAETLERRSLHITTEARQALITMAQGDGRYLLSLAEIVFAMEPQDQALDLSAIVACLNRRSPLYDKQGEGHYNLISALHKSIRASDPDAALYWLARMLTAGEDPRFLARRLVRVASEDIGNADPSALSITLAAKESYEFLGSPEGDLALAQAVVYLATAPKSVATYVAWKKALACAKETGALPPQFHSCNAPTKLMKTLGYGEGYIYDPNHEGGFSGQNHFPPDLDRQKFYEPKGEGNEAVVKEKLAQWDNLRKQN